MQAPGAVANKPLPQKLLAERGQSAGPESATRTKSGTPAATQSPARGYSRRKIAPKTTLATLGNCPPYPTCPSGS